MKIAAYAVRNDELDYLKEFAEDLHVDLKITGEGPSGKNASFAQGCEGVTILGMDRIDAPLLDAWKKLGVSYISTRTVGYNHIDLPYAHKIGMKVCNARYAPNGVADFTVMMMLMCLRNYKMALWRGQVNDYSLGGLRGREMKDLTVGIVGTGRIGFAVIRNLSGFGCRMLAYDSYENEAVRAYAEYVDLDTIFKECDIITLHTPLTDETYHLVNNETIAKMKDGVVIINCARGELADLEALIHGIESSKIGALGLDVIEGEQNIVHADHRTDILINRNMAYLRQFPNVVMTQHFAFYTDAAVKSMVECGIKGIVSMKETGTCETEIRG